MFSARKHEVMQLCGNLHLIYRLNKSKNLNYLINKVLRAISQISKNWVDFSYQGLVSKDSQAEEMLPAQLCSHRASRPERSHATSNGEHDPTLCTLNRLGTCNGS